ncbi:MAG: hypothetical protein ABUL47_04870, partial [Leifsonia sp.]
MSDSAPPPVSPAPAAAPSLIDAKQSNPVGLVGFILAIVAFVFAVVPVVSFIAWLPAIAAIVLSIVGLAMKNRKKVLPAIGLPVAAVALIVGIIVSVVTGLAAVSTAIDEANGAPSAGSAADSGSGASPSAKEAKIGDTVTNSDGVAFTVNSIQCGIAHAGDKDFGEDAKGQFCEV